MDEIRRYNIASWREVKAGFQPTSKEDFFEVCEKCMRIIIYPIAKLSCDLCADDCHSYTFVEFHSISIANIFSCRTSSIFFKSLLTTKLRVRSMCLRVSYESYTKAGGATKIKINK